VELLGREIGARDAVVMPARAVFRLGVGQMRRRGIAPGTRAAKPAEARRPHVEDLEAEDWRVISILMREFRAAELGPDPWAARIREARLSPGYFFGRVERLEERGLMGRFATVLDHTGGAKQSAAPGCTALLAWSVPPGCELEAGRELGRHEILTHAYWREAGPRLGCLNLFGVAHAADRDQLLAHRAAIDAHLVEAGVPLTGVGTYWSERALVRPSALQPAEYEAWYKRYSSRKLSL
jgi:DNA-binding Lrp family transcriptional regulator